MANIFNGLVTSVQANLDTVLREQIGFIPAVWMENSVAQAAVGQLIQYPIAPEMAAQDGAAACCDAAICPADTNFGVGSMVIDHDRIVNLCWTGEEDLAVNNSYGYNGGNFRDKQIQQGIRTLVKEIELSIKAVAYNAAQVYAPAGASLFASQADNLKDLVMLRKLLIDNNTPDSDFHLVMNTLSGANLRNLLGLTRANENGSDQTLRKGSLIETMNFELHESFASGLNNINGTGAGFLVNGAKAAGQTVIVVDTGTGTILAGQSISFAGDSGSYSVVSYVGNNITINRGLIQGVADNAAITLGAVYGAQLAFKREAIVLACRTPALIGGDDLATNRAYISDPYSGMTFTISEYQRRRATYYELAIVWGVKAIKPEMMVLIR